MYDFLTRKDLMDKIKEVERTADFVQNSDMEEYHKVNIISGLAMFGAELRLEVISRDRKEKKE